MTAESSLEDEIQDLREQVKQLRLQNAIKCLREEIEQFRELQIENQKSQMTGINEQTSKPANCVSKCCLQECNNSTQHHHKACCLEHHQLAVNSRQIITRRLIPRRQKVQYQSKCCNMQFGNTNAQQMHGFVINGTQAIAPPQMWNCVSCDTRAHAILPEMVLIPGMVGYVAPQQFLQPVYYGMPDVQPIGSHSTSPAHQGGAVMFAAQGEISQFLRV